MENKQRSRREPKSNKVSVSKRRTHRGPSSAHSSLRASIPFSHSLGYSARDPAQVFQIHTDSTRGGAEVLPDKF